MDQLLEFCRVVPAPPDMSNFSKNARRRKRTPSHISMEKYNQYFEKAYECEKEKNEMIAEQKTRKKARALKKKLMEKHSYEFPAPTSSTIGIAMGNYGENGNKILSTKTNPWDTSVKFILPKKKVPIAQSFLNPERMESGGDGDVTVVARKKKRKCEGCQRFRFLDKTSCGKDFCLGCVREMWHQKFRTEKLEEEKRKRTFFKDTNVKLGKEFGSNYQRHTDL